MNIGGFQKFSFIDYPDKISAVIFTQGCNFACGYCHNPELVPKQNNTHISFEKILSFLKTRVGKLEAITITGGEPLLQKNIFSVCRAIKELGFLVKVDTNGAFPKSLKTLIENQLVDYVAMDIKTSLKNYKSVIRAELDLNLIEQSIEILLKSKIAYEFRTTLVKGLIKPEDIQWIMRRIKTADVYYLQQFQCSKHLNREFLEALPFEKKQIDKLLKIDIVKTICR